MGRPNPPPPGPSPCIFCGARPVEDVCKLADAPVLRCPDCDFTLPPTIWEAVAEHVANVSGSSSSERRT